MDKSELMEWAKVHCKILVKQLDREIISEEEFYELIVIEYAYWKECE
jgi:hypothetical protein